MTKLIMIKKFMRETGTDKKTAIDYLRKCQWNYCQAMFLYKLPDVLSDITERIKKIVEDLNEIVTEAMQKVDWNEEIKKIQEREGEQNES